MCYTYRRLLNTCISKNIIYQLYIYIFIYIHIHVYIYTTQHTHMYMYIYLILLTLVEMSFNSKEKACSTPCSINSFCASGAIEIFLIQPQQQTKASVVSSRFDVDRILINNGTICSSRNMVSFSTSRLILNISLHAFVRVSL